MLMSATLYVLEILTSLGNLAIKLVPHFSPSPYNVFENDEIYIAQFHERNSNINLYLVHHIFFREDIFIKNSHHF